MPETLREYARDAPEMRPENDPRLLRTGYPRRRGGTAPRRDAGGPAPAADPGRGPDAAARRPMTGPAAAFVSIKRKKQKAAFSHHKTRHTAT